MDGLITKLQEFFERLLNFLALLQRLLVAIKQHPRTTAGIIFVLLFYLGLYWYAFEYPARTIHSFYNPARLLAVLFSRTVEYDVSFVAIDRFTKTDCQQKEQEDDCRWLQVSDPAPYKQLMDGMLVAREASSDPSLELKRYYKKKFTLYRVSVLSWLISGIDTLEVGLRR